MSVPFVNIPSNLRIPLFFAEIDPTHANTSPQAQPTLLIGQMISAGTYTPNLPVRIVSSSVGIVGAGMGSILAGQIAAYFKNDPSAEVWALPLVDATGSTAATGTVVVTGPATAAGNLPIYVAGNNLAVAISVGDTATVIAANIAAAIAAAPLPVTAVATAGTIALTAKNKGLCGNDIDVRAAYLGPAAGEVVPAGVGLTITAIAGGAVNPTISAGLAALGDQNFDFVVSSMSDTTTLAALAAFFSDASGRWSPLQQEYGHGFYALRGSAGTLAAAAAPINCQHLTCIGYNDSPTPSWKWASAMAGAAAASLRNDPAQPLQYLTAVDILAPPLASRFSKQVQNSTLLYSGVSTWFANANGAVTIQNMVTTYVTNAQGNADNSYLEIEYLFNLVYVLRFMNARVQTNFARVKLAADGTRLLPGSNVVTPSIIRADVIAAYREMEAGGFVQNSSAFAAGVIVEKDAVNPNRVNILWPGVLINQLRVFAMLAQFRLA